LCSIRDNHKGRETDPWIQPTRNRQPAQRRQTKPASGDRPLPLPEAATNGSPNLSPRRRKAALLPEIDRLALEGYSIREIGARLRIGRTTVHRWLRELRLDRRASFTDATGMIVNTIARYDSSYREAMEAWRNSKADKELPHSKSKTAVPAAVPRSRCPPSRRGR
jgi:transposase-like protein